MSVGRHFSPCFICSGESRSVCPSRVWSQLGLLSAIIDLNLSLFSVLREHFAHAEVKRYVPKKMQIKLFLFVVCRL